MATVPPELIRVPPAEEGRHSPTGTSRRNLLLAFKSAGAVAAVTAAVNLAVLPLILHRAGLDLYGAWATIAALLTVGGLADIGVRTEIIRRVGVAKGEGDDAALVEAVHQGLTLLVGVAGAVLLLGFIGAPFIRAFAFPRGVGSSDPAALDQIVRATFAVLALSLVGNGYFGVLRGVQRGDVEMVAQSVAIPTGAAVIVAGLALGWGLWALLLGSLTQLLVALGWQAVRARRLVPTLRPRLVRLSRRDAQAFLGLSGLILLCQVADVVDSQWDKLVLSHFVGSAAVASFQVGTSLVLQGKVLAALPAIPLLVAIAELRHRDQARMEALFDVLGRATMVLVAVVMATAFVFAPSFIRLWLGPDLAGAGHAARLFAIAVALNMIGAPLSFRALGEGWHAVAATSAVSNMVVNGVLSLWLTMAIGTSGPLYGSIVGNLTGMLVMLFLMRRKMGPSWKLPPLRALTVGALATVGAVVAGVDRVSAWPTLVLAAGLFVVGVGTTCAAAERLRPSALRVGTAGARP